MPTLLVPTLVRVQICDLMYCPWGALTFPPQTLPATVSCPHCCTEERKGMEPSSTIIPSFKFSLSCHQLILVTVTFGKKFWVHAVPYSAKADSFSLAGFFFFTLRAQKEQSGQKICLPKWTSMIQLGDEFSVRVECYCSTRKPPFFPEKWPGAKSTLRWPRRFKKPLGNQKKPNTSRTWVSSSWIPRINKGKKVAKTKSSGPKLPKGPALASCRVSRKNQTFSKVLATVWLWRLSCHQHVLLSWQKPSPSRRLTASMNLLALHPSFSNPYTLSVLSLPNLIRKEKVVFRRVESYLADSGVAPSLVPECHTWCHCLESNPGLLHTIWAIQPTESSPLCPHQKKKNALL